MLKSLFLTCSLLISLGLVNCFKSNTGDFADYLAPEPDPPALVYTILPGSFPDATKTEDTDKMCWAMAGCNVLVYAGYVQDERQCVSSMRLWEGNVPGHMPIALERYFKEYLDPVLYADSHEHSISKGADATISFIMDSIDQLQPVVLSLGPIDDDRPTGHVVSVYGYRLNDDMDEVTFLVTDGDDSQHTGYVHVYFEDGEWVIYSSGAYNAFEIGYAIALIPVN